MKNGKSKSKQRAKKPGRDVKLVRFASRALRPDLDASTRLELAKILVKEYEKYR
jgi:hypothetical protein